MRKKTLAVTFSIYMRHNRLYVFYYSRNCNYAKKRFEKNLIIKACVNVYVMRKLHKKIERKPDETTLRNMEKKLPLSYNDKKL